MESTLIKKVYDANTDTEWSKPFLDVEEIRTKSLMNGDTVKYHYFHGGFGGTTVKFSFHFPLIENYKGRFFQHLCPFPGPDEEVASIGKKGEVDPIGFALAHGSCFVESNMGNSAVFSSQMDSTMYYRSSAAVAEFCRKVAKRQFGEHRVYGYVYGGSGGGYKAMSCIENTTAWDGAVPFVIGSPVSLPTVLTVYSHGMRILRNAFPKIVDALEPGGSGDMYEGLTDEEKDALLEITRMGLPPRMCYEFLYKDDGSLPVLAPVVQMIDPDYFVDFWTKPGYLGTAPNSSAVRDRILMKTKVVSVGIPVEGIEEEILAENRNGVDNAWKKLLKDGSAAFIELETVPQGDDLYLSGVNIIIKSGKAEGKKLLLGGLEQNNAVIGMCYGMDDLQKVLEELQPGDEVLLDNSDYLAIQTYHRHQIPEESDYTVWDQYKDSVGVPLYPQRKQIISYGFTESGAGSVQDGHVQGKVIVMNNLMDAAFPWQADWYRKKVEQVNGSAAKDTFRLWYNDNCPHGDEEGTRNELRTTRYLGMLNQALLDLSNWVEQGVEPPQTTGYELRDGQVYLSEKAEDRHGIQPVVSLLANGKTSVRVKAGETVKFQAVVDLPPNGGELTLSEWSFEGEADYPIKDSSIIPAKDNNSRFFAEQEHCFKNKGTYFSVVKVTANRNSEDPYTQLRNLCRVRVVVE